MSLQCWRFALFLFSICALLSRTTVADAQTQLPNDAFRGWETLEAAYCKLSGRYEEFLSRDSSTVRAMFKTRGEQFLVELQNSAIHRRVVLAENPWYAFKLHTNSGQNEFAVSDVLVQNDSRYRRQKDVSLGALHRFLFSPFSLGTTRLVELFRSPKIVVLSISNVQRKDVALKRIEFKFLDDPQFKAPIESGWVLLNPGRYWRVEEAEYGNRRFKLQSIPLTPRYTASAQVTYDGLFFGGVPRIRRFDITYNGDPAKQKSTVTFYDLAISDVPDREFRLSHYGFPEPSFAPPVGPSSRMIAFALVAVALVLAILAYLLHRRRKRQGR